MERKGMNEKWRRVEWEKTGSEGEGERGGGERISMYACMNVSSSAAGQRDHLGAGVCGRQPYGVH